MVKLSEKVAVWKKKGWIPALGEAVRRGGDRESEGVGLRCVCVRDWRAGHRGGGGGGGGVYRIDGRAAGSVDRFGARARPGCVGELWVGDRFVVGVSAGMKDLTDRSGDGCMKTTSRRTLLFRSARSSRAYHFCTHRGSGSMIVVTNLHDNVAGCQWKGSVCMHV